MGVKRRARRDPAAQDEPETGAIFEKGSLELPDGEESADDPSSESTSDGDGGERWEDSDGNGGGGFEQLGEYEHKTSSSGDDESGSGGEDESGGEGSEEDEDSG